MSTDQLIYLDEKTVIETTLSNVTYDTKAWSQYEQVPKNTSHKQ